MTIDLTDTSTGAIHEALTQARRRMGGPASGTVLTLIIVTDESEQYDAVRAASQAGREHPSRILAVITRKPKGESRLDAEIRVGETGPGETILLRMYGPLGQHADSVVAPLLAPDVPVVTWWPDVAPGSPKADPLGAVAQRRVTDAAASDTPRDMLLGLAKAYQPGDTDLSWTRSTSWRSLLAATLDQPYPELIRGEVLGEPDNPSADLIAAWLGTRLGIEVQRGESERPRHHRGQLRDRGRAGLAVPAGRPQRHPGLARTAGAAGGPAPARHPGPDRRGTAPSRARRGLRGNPARAGPRRGKRRPVSVPEVLVHRDATLLAQAVAARLVTRLVDAVAARSTASVVLTGGGIGTKILAELAAAPARDAVDWRRLDIWWGDERFLPAGDPDRNETGARSALLDHVDADPARVHPMPGPDGPDGDDPEAAAARYASWLAAATRPEDHGPVPSFDVLMLGIGPEGHVASLFPGMPALYDERPVVAVRGSPKPPPTRLSLTLPSIQAAREVWILASGQEKANAIAMALSDAGPVQVPAAGARGRQRTLFLIDSAAAAKVPSQIGRQGAH